MIESTSITPTQSENRKLQAPVAPETPNPFWRTLIVVRWLQLKLSQVICRLHLLTITHGRSPRWRRLCRQVIQAGVALLMLAAIMPQPAFASTPQPGVSLPRPPQNQPGLEDASNEPGIANPFSGVDIGYNSTPSFADIDGDGDLDAFIGEKYGTIKYFQNSGNTTNPAFIQRTGSLNPFNGIDVGLYSTPSFADLDGDGDLDAFVGEQFGRIIYYQNTGNATSPAFIQLTGSLNPFNGVDVGMYSAPSFADLDADGDLDAFVGEIDGTIKYMENTGSANNPAFTERTGTNSPFNGVDVGDGCAPTFADLDGDGDLDAYIGNYYGTILYYQNTGTATISAFDQRTGSLNPFDTVDVTYFSIPSFADLDGDGDLELYIGNSEGTIDYIGYIRSPSKPTFIQRSGTLNPLDGVGVGSHSAPSFADLDTDGDQDAYIGEYGGHFQYFENTGSATNPAFVLRSDTKNPFSGVDFWGQSPTFADIDADGDLDAFIGEFWGKILYIKNTGSATSPAFIQITGSLNPLSSVAIGQITIPSFADLDRDGDLDAIIGEYPGDIHYLENTGSAISPAFIERSGTSNPFNGVDVGYYSAPSFADLDGDGDLDAFIGEQDGTINYLENTGNATSPAFIQRAGSLNPFDGKDVGKTSYPSFTDLDGDGDLDLFSGEYNGTIKYFERITLSTQVNLPMVVR
jgi:hypothetical protein